MKGKIIVLEGIDGSGKNTQAKKLQSFLSSQGLHSELLHFPLYEETFFGKEVANYLNGYYGSLEAVHPKFAAVLYAGDRYEKKEFLLAQIKKGTLLVCDRYVPSNIAHQGAKLPEPDRAAFKRWIEELEYNVFGLPRPDLVVFLDMPPGIAHRLVLSKGGRAYTSRKRDIHEENKGYLQAVYEIFAGLSLEAGWLRVMCHENGVLRPVEEIAAELCRKVSEFLF